MKIIIKRYRTKTNTIDGHVFIDGSRICDCAENAIHSLPTGKYTIAIIKCHQHARKMPVILLHQDIAPNCDHCAAIKCVNNNTCMPCYCAMLKAGNGVYNRKDGSIIVGRYLAPGCLSHPKDTFDVIYQRIRKSCERGHTITLYIIDDHPKSYGPDFSPYEMGRLALATMGGRPLNI